MKKVAIVAYETNPAVCSSMMMHVDMLAENGCNIVMIISSKIDDSIFDEYDFEKIKYNGINELKGILNKIQIDAIWCTNSIYVNLLSIIAPKYPIILWMQGDAAHESYMKHHSKIRRFIIQRIIHRSFRKASGVVFVSESMAEYYKSEYGFSKPYIVVPCLSEFASYELKAKKLPDSYVYIGGLSVWQCFDEILRIYKKIRTSTSVFHIITLDTKKAEDKVQKIIGDRNNIEIYSINDRCRIPSILEQFEYGFLIRKESVVNLVSSPIKFLEYLSCGVNVIITNAVPSYAKLVKDEGIGTVVSLEQEKYSIQPFSSHAKDVYNKYFARERFLNRYNFLINSLIK